MKPIFLIMRAAVAALLAASASAALAQVQTIQPLSPTADALAAQMRILGTEPNNVAALLSAGELALKLGDATAAARFFARAERIDPRNGRLVAGEASALVHLERPGEALRMFAQAESLGADPASFAAEQGLAFDLIGQQARAQRAYRLALRRSPTDDTTRRYALSLAIAGERDAALAEIDGQVRHSDRAGWRARAFILAMTGDVAGAEAIAAGMLPGTMASGLKPFFERLSTLGPVDRAFAVHFGELGPTPARVADARLAPVFPPLAPEPVLLADNPRPSVLTADRRDRRGRKEDRAARPAIVEATRPIIAPLPAPPRETVPTDDVPQPTGAQVQALPASATVRRPPATTTPANRDVVATGSTTPKSRPPVAVASTVVPRPAAVERRSESENPTRPGLLAGEKPPVQRAPTRAATPGGASADPVLAQIIAGIGVPPSERAADAAKSGPSEAPTVATRSTAQQPVDGDEARIAAEKLAADKLAADRLAADKLATERRANDRVVAEKKAAEKQAADGKLAGKKAADLATAEKLATDTKLADTKLADKKVADKKAAEKKAADKKAADKKAAEDKADKADPSRIWVQVAGGASVGDLPKAWAAVRAKAPALLKGKGAWTTPLRFTNRLLTGPFAASAEAQTFVNALAGQGVSGFVFTSSKGQVIAKVPTK